MDIIKDIPTGSVPIEVWRGAALLILSVLCLIVFHLATWIKAAFSKLINDNIQTEIWKAVMDNDIETLKRDFLKSQGKPYIKKVRKNKFERE